MKTITDKRRTIIHIDFNSYFASVEQQANPHLRGKPVGVTGGDKQSLRLPDGSLRMTRTVLGAASVEAKKYGVKTGMQIWEAKKLCPQVILVKGDSDKYLSTTTKFLSILKDYSPARNASANVAGGPYLEVFSIDEVFMELSPSSSGRKKSLASPMRSLDVRYAPSNGVESSTKDLRFAAPHFLAAPDFAGSLEIALDIKRRIREEIGEWMKCSIGISYNKLMAKLAGSVQKPDGLVVIPNQKTAIKLLDKIELDEICGIGPRIKSRLNNMGIFNFKALRQVPLETLFVYFKSYGQTLYNMARGIDESPVIPFYEKEEVKSIGHRHTIDHDTNDLQEIKQILLKLTELIARRLRAKKLVGKTVHCWYRQAFHLGTGFTGDGMQSTIPYTNDGLEIFKAAWEIFQKIWDGDRIDVDYFLPRSKIRMIGVSVSNLKPAIPQNLSLLPDTSKQETILQAIDKINDKFGEFTLQRGILLGTGDIRRKPNPYLADRRFKL